ncbi:hypothetical protein [Pseudomonas sp. OV546]|uniref:TRAFAC clade GTPase domain-containing protein n=1 Tax=Pseudomonas sp. OV546 TaxID=1881063 RepID=UPI0008EDC7CE|nr:hypothetical protein [Pseudomonas sp. OV546]SFU95030.1 hypothetical protein SAMN05428951_10727 [Pseudomonas sp. OV546]
MATRSVVLIGGPDSGKTNYLGRLWPSFHKRKGELRADCIPADISYVDAAAEHLMKGKFAPRSDRNLEVGRSDFSIDVRAQGGSGALRTLMVPDISGELWTRAVATSEISAEWMSLLQNAEGAILFLRHDSDQTVQPLDWVNARSVLQLFTTEEEGLGGAELFELPNQEAPDIDVMETSEPRIPTQVLLCELFRFLEFLLAERNDGGAPRLSVVIAAWDRMDSESRDDSPIAYLEKEFPLFAGRLACESRLDIKVFGLSIIGGDLDDDPDFRSEFLKNDLSEQGYVVVQNDDRFEIVNDVTLPIAWAIGE